MPSSSLTMNYMVRTLLFSLQYIRYLYVNVFIYACFWYLLLLKYITKSLPNPTDCWQKHHVETSFLAFLHKIDFSQPQP
jgi:hypothetical protein